MAVVLLKGTVITNADTGVLTNANIYRGVLREAVDNIEVTNGDSIGSIYRLCRVPSNARVSSVRISCDAIASATADFGVYRIAADGGAVVDPDFFGSAVALTGALVHSDVTHEQDAADAENGYGLADTSKMIWQNLVDAPFTKDPRCEFDIAATLTAAATGSGTLVLKVVFAV